MNNDLTRRDLLRAAGGLTFVGTPLLWQRSLRSTFSSDTTPAFAAFGAPANGEADDLPAWQAAFKTTPNGGVMHIPQGTYLLSAPLVIDRTITLVLDAMSVTADHGFLNVTAPNVSILGAGGRKTVVIQTATWQSIGNDHWNTQVFGVDGFRIAGVGFDLVTDGDTASITTTGAINIRDSLDRKTGSTNFEVADCWFRTRGSSPSTNNRFFGMFSGPPVGSTFNDGGRVVNNVFQQCKGRNVELGYTRNVVAAGNLFLALGEDGSVNDAGGIAFRILGGENISIVGNVIEAPASNTGFYGININGNWLNRNIVVGGNVIRSSAALGSGCYGMRITNARGVSIVGNRVWYEGTAAESHGILVYTNKNFPCDDVLIEGNRVAGWKGVQIGIAENDGVIATKIVARNNHTDSTPERYGTNNPDMLGNGVDFSEGSRQALHGWALVGGLRTGMSRSPLPDSVAPRGRVMPRSGSITGLAVTLSDTDAHGMLSIGVELSKDGGASWAAIPRCELTIAGGRKGACGAYMPQMFGFEAGDVLRLTVTTDPAWSGGKIALDAALEVES